eukprot:1161239-Pelagomonas_calceolata.AAC.6
MEVQKVDFFKGKWQKQISVSLTDHFHRHHNPSLETTNFAGCMQRNFRPQMSPSGSLPCGETGSETSFDCGSVYYVANMVGEEALTMVVHRMSCELLTMCGNRLRTSFERLYAGICAQAQALTGICMLWPADYVADMAEEEAWLCVE